MNYPTIVPKQFIPKVGYHIARNENLKSILKIGLTPKTSKSGFEHPGNRVYVLVTKSIEGLLKTKEVFRSHIKQLGEDPLVELSVLKVDLNEDMIYYFDPNFEPHSIHKDCFGIFVLRNIHPAYVELISELSDNGGVSSKDEEHYKNLKNDTI